MSLQTNFLLPCLEGGAPNQRERVSVQTFKKLNGQCASTEKSRHNHCFNQECNTRAQWQFGLMTIESFRSESTANLNRIMFERRTANW